MLRRRHLPQDLRGPHQAFLGSLAAVERGKEAVVSSVPTARLPGRPLADGLLEFEEGLREALAGFDAWRHPDLEEEWQACRAGIEEALRRAETLRLQGDGMPFDATVFALQDLIAPLEPFERAVRRFRDLRR